MSGLLAAATEPDSMLRSDELMDLVKSPTAIATGILLVFAKQQLKGNAGGIRRWSTVWACVASFGAILLTGVIVGVMTPLLVRILFINDGGVETRLLVFALTWMVAVGTAIYSITVLKESWDDYQRGRDGGFS